MAHKSTSTGSVFVSYAHDDLNRVRKLLDSLEGAGLKVWWDDDLTIGSQFRNEIEAALNTASCLIVVWSRSSVTRPWVLDEVNRVIDKGIVLPVVLEDGLKIPLGLGQIQHAKLERWAGGDHPELRKLISRVKALVACGPSKERMSTLARDYGTIADSQDIVSSFRRLTYEISHIGDVFASGSPATGDLRGALDEVGKTYRAVNSAILHFKAPAAQQAISAEDFLKLESSDLRSEIAAGMGHCHLIERHYWSRQGGLRELLLEEEKAGKLSSSDFTAIDWAFNQLSEGDLNLFKPLECIGELLANESRAVANLLLAGQEPAARQRILDGRAKLQPLEDNVTKAILELQKIESSLGYVQRMR